MIIKPERIVFETTEDVVDYISKGLPPTKKNFSKVMSAWNTTYDEYSEEDQPKPGIDVIIPVDAKLNIDDETFNNVCMRVYRNRVRNRNLALGIAGAVVLGMFGIGVSKHKKNKDDEEVIN